jgi:hypothetical protein
MAAEPKDPSADFIESVDDMIGRHFASDAKRDIQNAIKSDAKNWQAVEDILYKLIRSSIAHARSQVNGRKAGTMTFDEAVELVHSRRVMVTRPDWNIFCAIRLDDDGNLGYWELDNCDGGWSGVGRPYKPTEEERATADWMLYQAPQENWVELDL